MPVLDDKYNYKNVRRNRFSGILCHISSLPSPYGIGTFGEAARDFVDFLRVAGQKIWQILPLGTTGFGDSPYQNFSIYAGNPYFIDLEDLVKEGLLEDDALKQLDFGQDPSRVDYQKLWENRYTILRWAYDGYMYQKPEGLREAFKEFQEEADWLEDYCLFMAIKEAHGGISWREWPDELKRRDKKALVAFAEDNKDRMNFHAFLQFLFYRQWARLKRYATSNGIQILGDLPIYVAEDSVEVWKEPELFQMNEYFTPTFVAGCPPDYFSEDGQLWGNPLYDWDKHRETGYAWWIKRMKFALETYDIVRIDHFRGFESYWAVPYGDHTARRGAWLQGPKEELFEVLEDELGKLPVIAEDLGYMTKEVYAFRENCGFPSMKVLQFAFNPDENSDYLPHNMMENAVVYCGTHDNDTLQGWLDSAPARELDFARRYLGLSDQEGYRWGMMRGAMTTIAKLCIFQVQDLLGLGNEARMNSPGKAVGNWQWRLTEGALTLEIAEALRGLTQISGRLPKDYFDDDKKEYFEEDKDLEEKEDAEEKREEEVEDD